MDEDDEQYEPLPATPMQGLDLVILATDSITDLFRVGGRFFNGLTELSCRHANYRVERRRFASEVGLEIERMVSGE